MKTFFPSSLKVFIAATTVAVAGITAPVQGHAEEIVMATWGGGFGQAFRDAFAKPFKEKTDINVRVIDVPSPDAQVRSQKGAPRYNAVAASLFEAAALHQDGLLEDFDPADIPELKNIPDKYLLRTAEGRIIGVTTHFAFYGIAINTDMVQASEFQSWHDLTDPKWKDKIAMIRPQFSSTYDLPLYAYVTGGDEKNIDSGMKLLQDINRNALVHYSSLAHANQLLERNEVAAIPYYNTRVWALRMAGHKNIQLVIPKEGSIMIPYTVVVPKGAKDRDAYIKWLNYVASAEGQERLSEVAGYIPINTKAKLSKISADLLGMSIDDLLAQLYQPDWNFIADVRKERIELVEKALVD